jgi:hypothetical protein
MLILGNELPRITFGTFTKICPRSFQPHAVDACTRGDHSQMLACRRSDPDAGAGTTDIALSEKYPKTFHSLA